MQAIVLVIHIILALILVGLVLLQRSEGGGLGLGGSGGGGNNMGGLVSTRGSANFLTRGTAIVAALFMLTSIGLTVMVGARDGGGSSVLEQNETLPGLDIPMEDGETPMENAPEIPVTE